MKTLLVVVGNSYYHNVTNYYELLHRASVIRAGGSSSAICDFDFLLPDNEKDIIEGILNSIHVESNGNYGGAIAIIKKYDPRYLSITNADGYIEEYTEAYANHIFDKWKLKENDFLILLAIDDRQIYVTSGIIILIMIIMIIIIIIIIIQRNSNAENTNNGTPSLGHKECCTTSQGIILIIIIIIISSSAHHY